MLIWSNICPPPIQLIFRYLNTIVSKSIFIKHYTENVHRINLNLSHYCPIALHPWRSLKGQISECLQTKENIVNFIFIFCLWRYRAQVCLSTIFTYVFVHILNTSWLKLVLEQACDWCFSPSKKTLENIKTFN